MNVWDILILLAVGVMVYFAVRAIRGGKAGSCHKGGSCSACCENCAVGCDHCEKKTARTKGADR